LKVAGFALALLSLPLIAAERTPAPAVHCLDARTIERARSLDEFTLLVAAANGRFVVSHSPGCHVRKTATLLANDGWVCGADNEFVKNGEVACPVTSVARVDARTYAGLAAAADQREFGAAGGDTVLEPVEVTAAPRKRLGFRGDADYCFAIGAVRGWALDGNELIVQTSKRRAGGHASYRVVLGSSCPELEWADSVEFRSGVGVGMICGNAGDKALAVDTTLEPGIERRGPELMGRLGGCPVAAVHPGN
jgi:hypothetical protein